MTDDERAKVAELEQDVEVATSYLNEFNPNWRAGLWVDSDGRVREGSGWVANVSVLPSEENSTNIVIYTRYWTRYADDNRSGTIALPSIVVRVKNHKEVTKVDVR
jgi:hypothetical protein